MRADSGTVQWERCFWTAHAAVFPVSPLRYADMKWSLWFMKRRMVSLGQLLSAWSADDLADSNVVLMSSRYRYFAQPHWTWEPGIGIREPVRTEATIFPRHYRHRWPSNVTAKKTKSATRSKSQTCANLCALLCFAFFVETQIEISIFDHKIIMYTWKAIHRWSYGVKHLSFMFLPIFWGIKISKLGFLANQVSGWLHLHLNSISMKFQSHWIMWAQWDDFDCPPLYYWRSNKGDNKIIPNIVTVFWPTVYRFHSIWLHRELRMRGRGTI